jgi:hypothetical protein
MMNKLIGMLALGLSLQGCLLKTAATDSASGTTATSAPGTATKATANSSWAISNSAWAWDLSTANFGGSYFTARVIYADNSYCNCNTEMTGSNSAGTYITTCTLVAAGMANAGNCGAFNTDPTYNGSYTNSGSSLSLCYATPAHGSCLTYH